jgi:hypothetical protein
LTPPDQERLRSGKAVASALLLAALLLVAGALFLFVVLERACSARTAGPAVMLSASLEARVQYNPAS